MSYAEKKLMSVSKTEQIAARARTFGLREVTESLMRETGNLGGSRSDCKHSPFKKGGRRSSW